MSKAKTNTTTARADERARADELYNTAEKAVYICLRARHEKSGMHFLEELQNGQTTDRRCRNATEIGNRLTAVENELVELRSEVADLYKLRNMCDRQAVSLKNSEELRKEWHNRKTELDTLIKLKAQDIKHLTDEQSGLYKALDITFTDRADLTQTAVLTILQTEKNPAPITKAIIESYGVADLDELSESERADAQERANFKAVCSAVGKAMQLLVTPEALNKTTTKLQRATAEDVEQWVKAYGGTGKDFVKYSYRKRTRASDCYLTLEYKEYKDPTKSGYYFIKHYKTVAPYSYIEDLLPKDEEGGNLETDVEYIKSYNPLVTKSGDIESIEELCEKANLTDTERLIIEYYARALKYYTTKEDIINYVVKSVKLSKATVYRRLEGIKTKFEPIAKDLHIIK